MARSVDVSSALQRSFVFGALDGEARRELARAGSRSTLAAGTELFRAGDPCEEIGVLLRGRARLWRLTPEGHVLALRLCGPGEILGQMSALDGGAHSVGATAAEEVELLRIPAASFRALLQRKSDAAIRLAQALAQRVRELSDELEAMKYSSIGARLLRVLHALAAGRRELHLTHQALAEQVGATRENVSRVLGELRDRGVLRLGRGRIEVLDHAALAAYAGDV